MVTQAQCLMLPGRLSRVVALFNRIKSGECHNDENQTKAEVAYRLGEFS